MMDESDLESVPPFPLSSNTDHHSRTFAFNMTSARCPTSLFGLEIPAGAVDWLDRWIMTPETREQLAEAAKGHPMLASFIGMAAIFAVPPLVGLVFALVLLLGFTAFWLGVALFLFFTAIVIATLCAAGTWAYFFTLYSIGEKIFTFFSGYSLGGDRNPSDVSSPLNPLPKQTPTTTSARSTSNSYHDPPVQPRQSSRHSHRSGENSQPPATGAIAQPHNGLAHAHKPAKNGTVRGGLTRFDGADDVYDSEAARLAGLEAARQQEAEREREKAEKKSEKKERRRRKSISAGSVASDDQGPPPSSLVGEREKASWKQEDREADEREKMRRDIEKSLK